MTLVTSFEAFDARGRRIVVHSWNGKLSVGRNASAARRLRVGCASVARRLRVGCASVARRLRVGCASVARRLQCVGSDGKEYF